MRGAQHEPEILIAALRNRVRSDHKLADDKERLLSFIDQSILRNHVRRGDKSGLEMTFSLALEKLSKIYQLTNPALCYVFTGNEFTILQEKLRESTAVPSELPLSLGKIIRHKKSRTIVPRLVRRTSANTNVFKHFRGINTILTGPLYEPSGALLCLFLLLDSIPSEQSVLSDKGLHKFFASVISQLSIGYGQFLRETQKNNLITLWNLFLSSDLSPSKCFRSLAMTIPSCLPSFGPLRLKHTPEVQILVLEGKQKENQPTHLTVRATTGAEPDTTRIALHDSITGLLVEKSVEELPYFCDDPTKRKYGKRFKNYLGVGKNKEIKTELAVRLFDKSDFIGILNIESHLRKAFSIHHIQSVMALADQIAPMIAVFEDRLDQNRLTQYSLGATTARYLDSLASIFRHGIRTPILNLRTDLDFIDASLNKDLQSSLASILDGSTSASSVKLRQQLETVLSEVTAAVIRLYDVNAQIDGFANEFAGNISGFGELGRLNLCKILNEVVRLTNDSLLQRLSESIKISLTCKDSIDAFCSPLIKQYIYCLLQNALLSIQERMKRDPAKGLISISVYEDTSPRLSQERKLNERWIIKIRDNGTGVSKKQLQYLREFRFGTRFRSDTGLGYGLFATQRYVASVGGRIQLNSVSDKYFEVLLYLDKYREELHGPLSINEG